MLLHQFWQLFLLKGRRRQKLRLVGNTTPTVDVFVTCCGEEREIVVDTARAAAAQDWPIDRFRVVVLDDKADMQLKAEIEEMKLDFPNVFYTARVKTPGVPHHFKAGNLNHGLEFVKGLDGGAGEYMAALDADMIPEPEWLRAIIAHLVVEQELALSCPPQVRPEFAYHENVVLTSLALLQRASQRSPPPESQQLRAYFRACQRCRWCCLVYWFWLRNQAFRT